MSERCIVHENGRYWVVRDGPGLYRVYEVQVCASERRATFHFPADPDHALRRAITECDQRAQYAQRLADLDMAELYQLADKAGLWDYLGNTRETLVNRLFLHFGREPVGIAPV